MSIATYAEIRTLEDDLVPLSQEPLIASGQPYSTYADVRGLTITAVGVPIAMTGANLLVETQKLAIPTIGTLKFTGCLNTGVGRFITLLSAALTDATYAYYALEPSLTCGLRFIRFVSFDSAQTSRVNEASNRQLYLFTRQFP